MFFIVGREIMSRFIINRVKCMVIAVAIVVAGLAVVAMYGEGKVDSKVVKTQQVKVISDSIVTVESNK